MLSSISLPAVEPCQPSVVTVFSEDFKRHRPKVPMAQRKPKRRLAWTSHNFFHSFLTTKHGCTWSTSHRLGEKDSLIPCPSKPLLQLTGLPVLCRPCSRRLTSRLESALARRTPRMFHHLCQLAAGRNFAELDDTWLLTLTRKLLENLR